MRERAAGERGRLDQRVGGDRDVAGVRRARLDAVGVAEHEVGVAAPPDAQPGAVRAETSVRVAEAATGAIRSNAPGASTSAGDPGQRGELVGAGNHGLCIAQRRWRA